MLRKIALILLMLFLVQSQSMYYVKEGKDESTLSTSDQTISSSDGMVSVTIPSNWCNNAEWAQEQGMLLDLRNNSDLYINVYYREGDTAEKCVDDMKKYHEIIGNEKMFMINGADGVMFEYYYLGIATDISKAMFHGYEFIYNAPNGVIELDAYRAFNDPDSDRTLTDKEVSAMKRIAESLKIFKISEL